MRFGGFAPDRNGVNQSKPDLFSRQLLMLAAKRSEQVARRQARRRPSAAPGFDGNRMRPEGGASGTAVEAGHRGAYQPFS